MHIAQYFVPFVLLSIDILFFAMMAAAQEEARRTMDVVEELADLLNVGLSRETLSIVQLCEHGVSPDALAAVVKEIQREAKTVATKETEKVKGTFRPPECVRSSRSSSAHLRRAHVRASTCT